MMFAKESDILAFAMRPIQFLKNIIHRAARETLMVLPRRKRYRVLRFFADYDPAPSPRLIFKTASACYTMSTSARASWNPTRPACA